MGRRESERNDLAECAALSVSLGDKPTEREIALMCEFGLARANGSLTDAGWEAAGDAIGFDAGDHHA